MMAFAEIFQTTMNNLHEFLNRIESFISHSLERCESQKIFRIIAECELLSGYLLNAEKNA